MLSRYTVSALRNSLPCAHNSPFIGIRYFATAVPDAAQGRDRATNGPTVSTSGSLIIDFADLTLGRRISQHGWTQHCARST